jgi:hypothetical protein
MIIEYSIGELKKYYRDATPTDYTQDDLENIRLLEDRLSDLIDTEYTENSIIYHIFPTVALFAVSTFLLGVFLG